MRTNVGPICDVLPPSLTTAACFGRNRSGARSGVVHSERLHGKNAEGECNPALL